MGTLNRHRLVAAVLCVAAVPLAREVAALAELGVIAAVSSALVAYEAIRFREARRRIRYEEEAPEPVSG